MLSHDLPCPWRVTAGAALALAALGVYAPSSASAATVTTQNACNYTYDEYWRNLDIALQGVVDVPNARAGQTITSSAQAFDVALPNWLAETGYRFGILHSGLNEIEVSIWVALRGTNTVEGLQWQRLDGIAETTIVAQEDGTFVSATPITYSVAPLNATTWTAKGGDVRIGQAASGALTEKIPAGIPVGPNGALRKPTGSIYIVANLGNVRLGFDCLPGEFAGGGAGYLERPAAPYATTTVPTYECLSAVPAATNLAGVGIEILPLGDVAGASSGQPYGLASKLRYRLPQAYLQELYDEGRLQDGDNDLSGTFTVALDGLGTDPARRTVTIAIPAGTTVTVPVGGGAITVSGSDEPDAVLGTLVLPGTTWNPLGTDPLRFSAGTAGALGELTGIAGTSGPVTPYGGVYARLGFTAGTDPVERLSLDCVSGKADIADGGIAYSESGNRAGGDQGRYALTGYAPDPFVVAPVATPTPDPTPEPTPQPTATPGAPDPTPTPATPPGVVPVPTATPTVVPGPPTVQRKTTLRVLSTKLRAAKGKVPVSLQCAGTIGPCRGSVLLRTSAKVKVGRARKVVTVTRSLGYTVNPGFTKLYKLSLGKDGAALLRRTKKVTVTVTARPTGAKTAVTRKLVLSAS